MKKSFMLALLFLASCASQEPNIVGQPSDAAKYRADLSTCQNWAAPTRHEWAMRCAANGEMVMMSHLIDVFGSHDDPRDHDVKRQSMPNDTKYRLNICMKTKGYKVDVPDTNGKSAGR